VKANKMLNGSNHGLFHTLNFMRRICDYAWQSVRGIAEVLASFVGARRLLPVRVPVAMLCTVNFAPPGVRSLHWNRSQGNGLVRPDRFITEFSPSWAPEC